MSQLSTPLCYVGSTDYAPIRYMELDPEKLLVWRTDMSAKQSWYKQL